MRRKRAPPKVNEQARAGEGIARSVVAREAALPHGSSNYDLDIHDIHHAIQVQIIHGRRFSQYLVNKTLEVVGKVKFVVYPVT